MTISEDFYDLTHKEIAEILFDRYCEYKEEACEASAAYEEDKRSHDKRNFMRQRSALLLAIVCLCDDLGISFD